MNVIFIVGNLGADPEVRNTQDGKSVCRLRVATTERWTDKQSGERRESTDWHNVVSFNQGLNSTLQNQARKGTKLAVVGQSKTRQYEQDGVKKYATEVVISPRIGEVELLSSPQGNNQNTQGHGGYDSGYGFNGSNQSNSQQNQGGGFGEGSGFGSGFDQF